MRIIIVPSFDPMYLQKIANHAQCTSRETWRASLISSDLIAHARRNSTHGRAQHGNASHTLAARRAA